MDPFEEFEMRPLTEGLGFHKKAIKIGREAKSVGAASVSEREIPRSTPDSLLERSSDIDHTKKTLDELMAALDTPLHRKMSSFDLDSSSDVKITETLPRKEDEKKALTTDISVPMPPLVAPAPTKTQSAATAVSVRRSAADSPQSRRLQPMPVSLASAILDGVVVLALSLVFLVTLLLVTKVNLLNIFNNARQDLTTQISFAILYLAVMQMYVVVSRSFFSCTLGEWTFDLQMGDDQQIKKGFYPLLIVWRSLVIALTGVFLLPLLSLIIRRDLASYLTGLQLYRKE